MNIQNILKYKNLIICIFIGLIIFLFIYIFVRTRKNNKSNEIYEKIPKPINPIIINNIKNNSNILILQNNTQNYIKDNNKKYASKKNLNYLNFDQKDFVWSYINNIFEQKKYEYIMYLSSDMFIVDFNKDIRRIIQQAGDCEMILCRDEKNNSNVNLDAIIFRDSEWTLHKLKQLYWEEVNKNLTYKIIMEQLYFNYENKINNSINNGLPCLIYFTCIYHEDAFNSSKSSFIKNIKIKSDKINLIYPWKPIKGFVEINKNLDSLPKNNDNTNVIPKYIFQTMETSLLPENMYEKCIKKWQILNPNYKYFYFDSLDRRNFIKNNYNEYIYNIYNKLIPGSYKSDLWRYCVLYKYGGCYADIQTVPYISLDSIIKNMKFVSTIDRCDDLELGIMTGFLCSIPKHECLEMTIYDSCQNIYFDKMCVSALDITGPTRIGKSLSTMIKTDMKNNLFYEGIYDDVKLLGRNMPYMKWKNKIILRVKYDDYNMEKFSKLSGKLPYSILWKDNNIYKSIETKFEKINYVKLNYNNKYIIKDLTNPSLVKYNNNYIYLFRYWGKHFSKIIISESKNNELPNIIDSYNDNYKLCSHYNGMEDARVFIYNNNICAIANKRNKECNVDIYFVNLTLKKHFKIIPLFDYEISWKKNWTPFIIENNIQLYTVSIDPHIIVSIENDKASIKYISTNEYLYNINNQKKPYFIRNSAGVKQTKLGLLGIAHIVLDGNDYNKRKYINFFYIVNNKPPYNILKVSKFFMFDFSHNVEFIGGMEIYNDQYLIITVGIEDKDSLICYIDISNIKNLFS